MAIFPLASDQTIAQMWSNRVRQHVFIAVCLYVSLVAVVRLRRTP